MGIKMRPCPRHGGVALLTALAWACGSSQPAPEQEAPVVAPSVAFMADVHFENVYGDFKSPKFAGIPAKDGKNASIRTMYAQLTSTRLFNENYFAFRAALDDAYAKGVRLVAFPGDYSDDAQPINIDGFAVILHEYRAKGMRFFLAPGNHDPNEPYDDDEAGKNDFLTQEGKEQKVYATGSAACKAMDPSVVCTGELMEQGYEKLIAKLGDFGFMPDKADLYWETPFSQYRNGLYSYDEAVIQGDLKNRQFEMCAEGEGGRYKEPGKDYTKCSFIIDSSYLVEPVKDLWLLSIDANVFIPNSHFDPANPEAFKGFDGAGNAGWNKVLTHKKHQLDWIRSVAGRAKAQGKQLMAFSHYPAMDFYANQTAAMKAVFKPGAFQTARVPEVSTTAALASTGLQLHIGGHMHFNGTNDYHDEAGHFLVNVQSPSLAVYGAAYKIVTYKDQDTVEVQTIGLNSVPRYDELFPFYQTEYGYLQGSTASGDVAKRWDRAILETKSYGEFTRHYFGELSRLRFMDEYWPCEMKEAAMSLNAKQMLILSQLRTQVTLAQLKDAPGIVPISAACAAKGTASGEAVPASQLVTDWTEATAKASQLAGAAGLTLDSFEKITAHGFYGDFHRTVYAGELALRDMGAERVSQYKVLMGAFPDSPPEILKIGAQPSDQNAVHVLFQSQFKQVFAIFKGLGSAKPSGHFTIDFKGKRVSNARDDALSFNEQP
ncbi:metallophosphoesterase family protein [Stigmatella aurantiaca]|uniref:Calcineurin-like phosphoesterase n=1 Tax=Stigmatella aurantiaca (strain DW4/3-1) TaxID=378806 RepID=Q09AY9_STIAD|nr:metallophosphoesterase [Stigmatella aurantiaca]ADO72391.1 Calcineurin-like phosphoesterase [Stigmatella aurantiaca DW4/3-1]EAU68890.1 Ser/Thr protein phosphatase family protein [Stigmatella aurantiaca DW4/3-1]